MGKIRFLGTFTLITLITLAGCGDPGPEATSDVEGVPSKPAAEWYVLAQETRIGPMNEGRLRREAAKGRFRTDEQVWSPTLDDWSSISSVIPDIETGGTEEAGTAWAGIFRKAERVPEPMIPAARRSGELTPLEIKTYLRKGDPLLVGMRQLAGQYGPEPFLDSNTPIGRLANGRRLSRMLRHDIRQAVKSGDRDRAMQDVGAMCGLARQLSISRSFADHRTESNAADDHYELSNRVSLSVIRQLAGIIVDPSNAAWSPEFKDIAMSNLQWVDADLRATFQPNLDGERNPVQQASLELTRELLGS